MSAGSEDGGRDFDERTDATQDDDEAEDLELVGEEFLLGITFLVVKVCVMCGHKSNEHNPIKKGRLKATKLLPCWPWRFGTSPRSSSPPLQA